MGESATILPEHPPEPGPGASAESAPVARKSRRTVILLVAAGVLLACIVCIAIAAALIGVGTLDIMKERGPIEDVLREYMNAMEVNDAEAAFELFSAQARQEVSLEEMKGLLEGNNYWVFKGYQDITIDNLAFRTGVSTGPEIPQGQFAIVEGRVTYEGGFVGSFEAVLQKDAGRWRLFSIFNTVPPEKFGS